MNRNIEISNMSNVSLRAAALIAGLGYLVIFITGIFANFFVIENMIVPGNAAATVKNIVDNESLYRIGILSFIIMVIFDVVLAWALYILLKPVNKSLSLLSAWLRLVNATIFGIALYNLLNVLLLINGADYLAVIGADRLHAQAMLYLDAFNYIWLLGLVFFAFHLFVLGYLAFKSGYIPRIIGALLIIAGLGYLVDSLAHFLLSNYANYEAIFSIVVVVPGVVGELSFTIWLLIKGAGIPEPI
jgi:hypothetical protein